MADIKTIKWLLIAIVASLGMVSCSDEFEPTFIGTEQILNLKPNQKLCYEDMHHVAEFDTTANKLFTVEQYIDGSIVVRENGDEVSRMPFGYNLNLEALFTAAPEVVYVSNKDNLSDVAMTSSTASDEKTGILKKEGEFQVDSTSRSYEFNFNEGETITAETIFEKLSHKDTTFAYAEVKNVSYKEYDATLNEAMSNADSTVYDINLYFGVEVVCKVNSDLNETYKVRVPVRRIFKEAPAEAVTEIADVEHKAQFDTTANKLFTVEQYVAGDFVTTLRGEEIGRKAFKYDLNLEVLFTATPEVVYVDAEPKLSEVALKSSNAGEMVVATSEKDDFVVTSTSRSYEFNFNEGEKVTAETVFEKLTNADTEFAYAEIKNVSYKEYEAKKNEGESDADKTVYDIDLYFSVEVVCKANSSVNATYLVRVPVKRIFAPEKPDTFETVLENLGYVGEFDTKTKELYTVKQKVNGDWVTYKNNEEEVSRESFERDINLEAIFDVPEVVYVDSELSLSDVKLTSSTRDGDVVRRRTDAGFTTTTTSINHNFRFNENEKVVSATSYEKETYGEEEFVYSSIVNVSYKEFEAKKNDVKSNADSTVFDVILYFDVTVKREGEVLTRAANTQAHTVAVPYMRVYKHVAPPDELIGKNAEDVRRRILDENTEEISWTEVESWTVSGDKRTPMSYKLYRSLNEPSLHWVYTTNSDYVTSAVGKNFVNENTSIDGNWTVTTRYEEYISSADNGANSFSNVYTYSFQKAVYENEYYRLTFDYADWTFTEGVSEVTATANVTEKDGIAYDVYDYVNNINTVYALPDDSYTSSAMSKAKIAVEQPAPSIVEDSWGKIIGAGISAVPADDERGAFAKKALCIRTEKGAVSIVFDMASIVPSTDMIQNGYFVEGDFSADYNSAFFTTSKNKGDYVVSKWVPAIAKDENQALAYYFGNTLKASVLRTTAKMWNWRNGNISTVVDGYSFSVSADGTLTVKYEGKVAMRIK